MSRYSKIINKLLKASYSFEERKLVSSLMNYHGLNLDNNELVRNALLELIDLYKMKYTDEEFEEIRHELVPTLKEINSGSEKIDANHLFTRKNVFIFNNKYEMEMNLRKGILENKITKFKKIYVIIKPDRKMYVYDKKKYDEGYDYNSDGRGVKFFSKFHRAYTNYLNANLASQRAFWDSLDG